MGLRGAYQITGYLSIFVGAVATACISRASWLYYGVALAFIGMVLGIINVFLSVKYFSDDEKAPKGYIGMFLSSLPVVFLMLVIFKFRK
jgi:hypothetical protein